jgi:hypothetical protein
MNKLKNVKGMPIHEFKNEILIPLFRTIGHTEIAKREGIPGYGDEITCCMKDDFSKTYMCFQVIPRNIVENVNETVLTNEIFMLTQHALRTPILDIEDKKKTYATIFRVITTENYLSEDIILRNLKNLGIDAKIEFMSFEKILDLIETKMPNYIWKKEDIPLSVRERILEEFKKKLDCPELPEEDFKQFFKENQWLLKVGLKYEGILPEQKAGSKLRVDFLLKRYDGYYDIMELKRHTEDIIVGGDWDWKLSSKCEAAICQVLRYMDYYQRNVANEYYDFGIDVYQPWGYIVIGQITEDDIRRKLRLINSTYHRIKIKTYDDLYEEAKRLVETSKQLSNHD